MSSSYDEGELTEEQNEASNLLPTGVSKWTKNDLIHLAIVNLVKFGDAVETYLPGVINQAVSCDLLITPIQSSFLDIAMYVSLFLSTFANGPLMMRVDKRMIILVAMITSVLLAIFCAIVMDFYTLLISRLLVGAVIGMSMPCAGVLFSEQASSRRVGRLGSYWNEILFATGGVWIGILGYLMLDKQGWRVFLVSASIPVFIPPMILLAIVLIHESMSNESQSMDQTKEPDAFIGDTKYDIPEIVPDFKKRIIKVSLCKFINLFQGYGTIILVPTLLREVNIDKAGSEEDCAATSIYGVQYLIIAAVGVANVGGRLMAFLLPKFAPFNIRHGITAAVIAVCYGIATCYHDTITITITMIIAKLLYAYTQAEFYVKSIDPSFFGKKMLGLGSSVVLGVGYTGVLVGIILAAFAPPTVATGVTCIVCVIQVFVCLSFTEF